MHRPAMAVVLGVMLLGCGRIGPGTSTHLWTGPQERPCAESIAARAAGTFDQLATRVKNPYLTYHRRCEVACNLKNDAAACAEATALTAQYRQQVVYVPPVVPSTGPRGPVVRSTTAMDAAADAAMRSGSSNGYNLGYDELLSLDDGNAAFEILTQPSLDYLIILIGDTTTTFTAEAGAAGIVGKSDFTREYADGVFMMTLAVSAPGGEDIWVRITDAGGDRGTVRAMRFEKWR